MTGLRSGSATDVGRRRQINQDMILESDTIFAVADGMGGHQGGEVASLTAVETLRIAFRRDATADGLESAIRAANDAVEEQAMASAELRNMGTTLTAIALVPDSGDELLTIAHIGDSRAYLLRDGELSQLTDDHSVPEELVRQGQLTPAEAAVDPRRHVLTRVIGASFGEGPDVQKLVPYAGDRLLICSDGLYNEVDDNAIATVMRKTRDPKAAARQLVEMANANGGADNISVVVIDVTDDDGRAESASAALAGEAPPDPLHRRGASGLMSAEERNVELRRLNREEASGRPDSTWGTGDAAPDEHVLPSRRMTVRVVAFVIVLLIVLGGAFGATAYYARGAYYVGFENGGDRVTIFKGRPGSLLWFKPTVEEPTTVTRSAVPPSRVDDLTNGREFATIDEARSYVRNLAPPSTTTTSAPPTTTEPTPTSAP